MQNAKIQGPSFAELRPAKHVEDKRQGAQAPFPIYPKLVDHLCGVSGYDANATHVCAVMSGWAYSDPQTLAAMMVRLGLEKNRCRYLEISNNSMFIRSSAYLIQSECGRVAILAYRGTDPFDFSTWAADADAHAVTIPIPGAEPAPEGLKGQLLGLLGRDPNPQVHGGFYRNQRATWFDVVDGLLHALRGESILLDGVAAGGVRPVGIAPSGHSPHIHPLEALYITGHSLGAAMATIAAYKVATDPAYEPLLDKLKGVYTFAPPMIGNRAFAEMWKRKRLLNDKLFAHVYANDVVPRLPPRPAGDFEHVGLLFGSVPRKGGPKAPKFRWEQQDRSVTQVESLAGLVSAVVPLVAEQIPGLKLATDLARHVPFVEARGLGYSFYDHSATYYIDCSKGDGHLTEFGDDF